MVWRRIKIAGNASLAYLHSVIQIIYDWENENLHRFRIYGKDYGISYSGGMSFADDARKVYIDDFKFDVGDKFVYEYNFFKHWILDLRVEKIKESKLALFECEIVSGNNMFGVTKYDKDRAFFRCINFLAKADPKTPMIKVMPYIEVLNKVVFNKKYMNLRLKKEIK